MNKKAIINETFCNIITHASHIDIAHYSSALAWLNAVIIHTQKEMYKPINTPNT